MVEIIVLLLILQVNWSENNSAIAWTNQTAITTSDGKAMACFFCPYVLIMTPNVHLII